MTAPTIDDLILRSSLGKPSVQRLRSRTPPTVAEEIVRRTDRTKLLGKSFLVRMLQELDRRQRDGTMTVIDISYGDAFDFGSLGARHRNALPLNAPGATADWRISCRGHAGLHGLIRADGIAFHLDGDDLCRSPSSYQLEARVIKAALIGSLALAVAATVEGGTSSQVAAAALVGAGVGGTIAASAPAERVSIVRYHDLIASMRSVTAAVRF